MMNTTKLIKSVRELEKYITQRNGHVSKKESKEMLRNIVYEAIELRTIESNYQQVESFNGIIPKGNHVQEVFISGILDEHGIVTIDLNSSNEGTRNDFIVRLFYGEVKNHLYQRVMP